MSKMKDWMMDMDEQIAFAMENGATSTSDVVAIARTNLKLVDEKYIERQLEEINGPMDF